MIRYIAALFMVIALPARAEIDIQAVQSPGGIPAWLVEEHSIPFVALQIWFDHGASDDPTDKAGVSNLMISLLDEGAGDLDARAFAAQEEALATSFGFNVYDDTTTISAQFLTENRAEALALLRLALTQPRFDADAIERVRAQVQSVIASDSTDPDQIAFAAMDAALYGDHSYAQPMNGTPETISALGRDDLVDAHARLLTQDRIYVGAVGDITAAELGEVLDELLGSMPMARPEMANPVDPNYSGGVEVIKLDTPQSVAIFAQPGLDRDDPDYFAAYLLNEILGGRGIESRLTREVRENRGLTYGISTFLVSKDEADIMMGKLASSNDRIAQAMDVIRDEWAKMAEQGVTEAELDAVKKYLTGAYPLRFDGNGPIARILAGMQIQGLPTDYIRTRNDQVNAVTLADINRVAAELLQPDELSFIVVGQPEGLGE